VLRDSLSHCRDVVLCPEADCRHDRCVIECGKHHMLLAKNVAPVMLTLIIDFFHFRCALCLPIKARSIYIEGNHIEVGPWHCDCCGGFKWSGKEHHCAATCSLLWGLFNKHLESVEVHKLLSFCSLVFCCYHLLHMSIYHQLVVQTVSLFPCLSICFVVLCPISGKLSEVFE
jgi:hypothetical protein